MIRKLRLAWRIQRSEPKLHIRLLASLAFAVAEEVK